MAIGSVVLILAATMLGTSGDGYERVGGGVASEREARALITQLASDFSTATFHKDGVIDQSSTAWPAARIGFLSLQPAQAQTDDGRIGDLCSINYYLEDLTIGGKTVRCLMRGFRESKDTFAALRAGAVGPLFDPQPDIDEPVAFGVVSFEAQPRIRDATGNWMDWVKSDETGPEAFDIKLVLARRDIAARLKLPADWDGTGAAGKALGEPSKAEKNKGLEIYETTLRFGNHATQ